jgi:hypothetical protein
MTDCEHKDNETINIPGTDETLQFAIAAVKNFDLIS